MNTIAPVTPSISGTLLSLLLVLGLIIALGWVLRRMPQRRGARGADALRVRASLALGTKQRLVLIEAAGKNLLLGVSASGITCLHRYDGELPELVAEPNVFAGLLQRAAGATGGHDAR